MEPEEMAKNVDACYKNILDKFNPGARQLINAGKSYLKSLHGAAAAAKIYLESLSRVAKQAQQGTCGGTADIGIAMQQMVDVQREIQSQQLNTLKAFYVDLIVPLESNIEKDTKVVQADHKKFNQQYRCQYDVYSKAMSLVKKHSKKSSSKVNRSSASYDKEIKHMQTMDEEKAKLDAFCEQSLKEAIAQERKRYGFVLERQTSLSKHFLAHYGKGAALLEKHLDGWQETSKAREELPPCVEFLLGQQSGANSENLYALPRTPVLTLEDEVDFCSASQMRKSHSIDTSYLYEEAQSTFTEAVNPKISANQGLGAAIGGDSRHMGGGGGGGTNLCKSKSEFNLAFASPTRSVRSGFGTTARPKSLALPGSTKGTVRALYAYLSSGEHQINFLEGDLILLLGDEPVSFHSNANGDRNKGWYYGENVRTGKRGWFPLAYTEQVKDADVDSGLGLRSQFDSSLVSAGPVVLAANNVDAESTTSGNSSASNSSASGGGHITQITSPPASTALKSSCARNAQVVGKQQLNNNATNSRPNSLLLGGDRPLFNKVPGFSKLRKSRSAFAERLLFPATTPSAPCCPATTPSAAPVPSAEHDGRPSAGAAPASPSPMSHHSTMTMLPLSHSSSTPRMFSSCCTPAMNNSGNSSTSAALANNLSSSSPSHSNHVASAAVFSPTKKAPAPPPRLQTILAPQPAQHPHHSLLLGMTNAADLSLRSSSDSGFATEPASAAVQEQPEQQHQQPPSTLLEQQPLPPPAPEVDYSDEESLKFPPNLSRHWLLYSSALDVSQSSMCSASSAVEWTRQPKSCSGNSVGSDGQLEKATGVGRSNYHNQGLSMTLDRPTKTRPTSGVAATVAAARGSQHQRPAAASASSCTSSVSSISTSTCTSSPSVIRTGNHKLSSYPPVLGYLATLTRSKASKQLRRHRNMGDQQSSAASGGKSAEKENQQVANDQQPMSDRSAAVRRLSGLFTKNSSPSSSSSNGSAGQRDPVATATAGPTGGGGSSMATAAKIKNKLSAAPGILKTALFRTRSKDSFLDTSLFFQDAHQQPSPPSSAAEATPWQHKSSVPCYVGWRPPMPLPKSCQATDVDYRPPSAMNSNSVRRRVTRTESRRSNLGWRKYGSESDLLDPTGSSESGYMAIDPFLPPMLPSWPPTLALLHPFFPGRLGGGCHDEPYSRATNYAASSGSVMPHTLPRKFQPDSWLHSSSPSLRVQFNLDQLDEAPMSPEESSRTASAGEEQRQIKAEFEEYSLRLKQRLQLAKSGSSHSLDHLSDAASDGQACEPWYDLWAPEISVRLCEIAQL